MNRSYGCRGGNRYEKGEIQKILLFKDDSKHNLIFVEVVW